MLACATTAASSPPLPLLGVRWPVAYCGRRSWLRRGARRAPARRVALSLRTTAESALRAGGSGFVEFEPVAASQQVVAGMSYAIKARRRRMSALCDAGGQLDCCCVNA